MNQKNMETLIKLLRDDMKPALGVTEPGAIAFAAAKAREFVKGACIKMRLRAGFPIPTP